jgi:hypothetical protein
VQTDEVIPVQVGTTLIDNATNLTIEVPVGGGVGAVNVSNSDDTFTVNTSVDLELADITHTDSDGSTSSLPAQEGFVATQCPTLVDGIVTIDDEDGNVLHTVNVANGGSVTQEIANSNITNSTGTFNDTVLAEGSKTLADITHTDSDGTSVVVSAQTPFVATQCPAVVIKTIGYNRPAVESLISYRTGDEAWYKTQNWDTYVFDINTMEPAIQDLSDWWQLTTTNAFGNTYRFTSKTGGYYDESDSTYRTVDGTLTTFDAEFKGVARFGYIVDNLTGLGYMAEPASGQLNYAGTINALDVINTAAPTSFYHSFTDWKVPSVTEMLSIMRPTVAQAGLTSQSPYWISFGTQTATNYGLGLATSMLEFNGLNFLLRGRTATLVGRHTMMRYHFT